MAKDKITIAKLKEIIEKSVKNALRVEFDENTMLVEAGVLDSFSIIEVVFSLEQAYGFAFDYSDVNIETFASMKTLFGVLTSKYKL